MSDLFRYHLSPNAQDRDTSQAAASEEWRAVLGWNGYEVSESGRVRNGSGLIMKPWQLRNGRWQIQLSCDGSSRAFFTYQLVAWAFLGPPPFPGAEVAHRNDNKDNNHWTNLQWSTHRDNCLDRTRNGRAAVGDRNGSRLHPDKLARGEQCAAAKLSEAAVAEIRATVRQTRRLADKHGVSVTTVKDVRRGKTWRHSVEEQRR